MKKSKNKNNLNLIDQILIFLISFSVALIYASFWAQIIAGSWLAIIPKVHLFYAFMFANLVQLILAIRYLPKGLAKKRLKIGTTIFLIFVLYIIPVEHLSFITKTNPIVYTLVFLPPLLFCAGMLNIILGVKAIIKSKQKINHAS